MIKINTLFGDNEIKGFLDDEFVLLNKDSELIYFKIDKRSVKNVFVTQVGKDYLDNDFNIAEWLNKRVQYTRKHIIKICNRYNLATPLERTIFFMGLSLNDTLWVKKKSSKQKWKDVNLYENKFTYEVAQLSFLGVSETTSGRFNSSPDVTTAGVIPKFWKREDKEIFLVKALENSADVISEIISYQIAQHLQIDCIEYTLGNEMGRVVTKCKLFTSQEIGYTPISHYKLNTVDELNNFIDVNYLDNSHLQDMYLLDYITGNDDRHQGNFGVLVNNNNPREIIRLAPIFDNGFALFSKSRFSEEFKEMENNFRIGTPFSGMYDSYRFLINKETIDRHKERLSTLISSLDIDYIFAKLPQHKWRKPLILDWINDRVNLLLYHNIQTDITSKKKL